MKWPNSISNSISRKIITSLLIFSGIMTALTTILQLSFDYVVEFQDLNQDLTRIESGYKNSVTNSLWELHMPQLRSQLEGIVSSVGIIYAEVNSEGKILVSAGQFKDDYDLSKTMDLNYNDAGKEIHLGQLRVIASADYIKTKILRKVFVIFLMQFFKTLLTTFLIYLVIQKLLTRHLIKISNYLKAFDLKSVGNYLKLNRDQEPSNPSNDELDILVSNINNMRQELANTYSELSYLNDQLEKKVQENTEEIILQRQQLEFSSKMSALGEMAGGIAHEINTPLAAIGGSVQILLRQFETGQDPEKEFLLKNLKRTQATVQKIALIVQGLRTFSRDGSGDPFDQVSVKALVDDTISLCREKIINSNIQLDISIQPEYLIAHCRFVQISQVLLNLLTNSFDAIVKLPDRWIRIEAFEDQSNTYFSVIDSGKGVADHLKAKIFQPFFSTKELGKGTGLGLSISQSIMRQHGGRIEISERSGNTCFTMVIPKTVQKQ